MPTLPAARRLMRASVAVVADDLTGAADAGIGFARAGLVTTVHWVGADVSAAIPLDGAAVVAIDSGSRAMSTVEAVQRVGSMVAGLRAAGLATLYKKIDSTLRGHIGEELAASLTAWYPWSVAIVAPAFPAMGRTTIDGELQLAGALQADRSLLRSLERAALKTDHANLTRVRGGSLGLWFEDSFVRGVRAVVCDAVTDEDLDAVAAAGAPFGSRAVWVGSGGLARALPRHLSVASTTPAVTGPSGSLEQASRRPVLIVVGSRTSAARDQVRDLVDSGTAHAIAEARDLAAWPDGPNARAFLDLVRSHLSETRDVVVSIGARGETMIRDDARLAQVLGAWLRPMAASIGGLVLTGGDTALGVLRAWEVTALRLIDEIEPGVPLSTATGAVSLPVVTKAGGFGGPTTLSAARDTLKARFAATAG